MGAQCSSPKLQWKSISDEYILKDLCCIFVQYFYDNVFHLYLYHMEPVEAGMYSRYHDWVLWFDRVGSLQSLYIVSQLYFANICCLLMNIFSCFYLFLHLFIYYIKSNCIFDRVAQSCKMSNLSAITLYCESVVLCQHLLFYILYFLTS